MAKVFMSISISETAAVRDQQTPVGRALGLVPKLAPASVMEMPVPRLLADVQNAGLDKPDAKRVQESIADINKVMAGFSISVQFKIDPDYKELIVKVVDQETGQLIRQIPTEEVVKMSKAMDNLKGLLFAQSA
jgi:flagellar protein FlaG